MRQEREDKSMTLTKAIKEYIDLKLEYFQLAAAERISLLIGNIILISFIALLGFAVLLLFILLVNNLLMAWIGIAWLVGVIEIVFVCLLIVFLWIFRDYLVIKPVANVIVRTLLDPSGKFKTKEDDEKDE